MALFSLFAFNPQALAAVDTWTGADTAGTPTTDWVNSDNWNYSTGTGPVASGDSLVFGGANGQATNTLTDSLTNSSFAINGITFNAGAPAYTMTGNAFLLTGGITNNGTSVENIGNAVVLSGTETFTTTAGGGNIVMSGPISDGGTVQGVTAAGSGILRLSGSDSYYGQTTVNAGSTLRLVANSSNTLGGVTSALSNNSYALVLNTGATLQLLGNTTNTIFEPASAPASVSTSGLGVQESGGGAYNLYVGNDGGTASPTTLILGNMGVLGETGNVAYSYNIGGANGYTLQLGSGAAGTGSLYFQNNEAFNVTNPGVTVSVPGGFDLNYPSSGYYTLSFGGQGNYNLGAFAPLSGNVFNVNFDTTGTVVLSTPSGGGVGAVTANAGTTQLNFSASGAPTANILNAAATLTLGGGTVQVIGATTAGTSQTFAGLTANPGMDVISAAPVSGSNLPTVTLGAITQNVGGSLEFVGPATVGANNVVVSATATITTTTQGGNLGAGKNYGLLWNNTLRQGIATVGLYDWASTDTTAGGAGTSPYTIIGGSQVTGFYTNVAAGGTATANDQNFNFLGNATANNTALWYGDTFRFNAAGAYTFTTNSTAGHIALIGGILVTPNVGANNTTIANGGAYLAGNATGANTNGAVDVFQNDTLGELLFNVPLTYYTNTTRATSYVQAGQGTVVLNGSGTTSNNTGAPYLNGGVTEIAADTELGAAATAATLYLNGGTVLAGANLSLDSNNAGANARPVTIEGNGGGFAAIAGDTLTVDGAITSYSAATGNGAVVSSGPVVIGIPASSANSNTLGLVPGTGTGTANTTAVYATGTVLLTGANTYSGGTELDSGTLQFSALSQIGGANYGGIILNGGTLQYGASNTTDLSSGPVTILSPGGIIDVNNNAVTYLKGIGNGGTGSLTVASSTAGGSLTLDGINTFTGGLTDNAGATVNLNGPSAITGAVSVAGTLNLGVAGTLSSPASLTLVGAGALNLNGQTITTGSFSGTNSGARIGSAAGYGGTLTVNQGGATNTFAGIISGANVNFATLGTGTTILTGANSYTGTTTVGGTSTLRVAGSGANLGSGAITVNGGTLNVQGALALGGSGTTLALSGGSTFSMVDSAVNTVTIAGAGGSNISLSLNGTTTSPDTLDFEISSSGGSATGDELVVNTGSVAFAGSNPDTVIVGSGLASGAALTSGTTVPILYVPNGTLSASDFTLGGSGIITIGSGTTAAAYRESLAVISGPSGTNDELVIDLTNALTNYYWTGKGTTSAGSWTDISNFATDHTGGTPVSGVTLNASSNIFLTADSNLSSNYTESLNGIYTINSLNFTGAGSGAATNDVTLAPGAGGSSNYLILNGAAAYSNANSGATYAAGTGLAVEAGSAAHTISANLELANSQIWAINNSSANPLTVSGTIGNVSSAAGLTKTGPGTVILSANNTYSGGTTIYGGTVQLGVANALLPTGALTVSGTGASAGTLDLHGNNQTVGSFSDGSASVGVVTNSTGSATLTDNNGSANSYGGTLTDSYASNSSTLGITEAGGGSLTLSGSNSYNGQTVVTSGTLVSANNYAFGNPNSSTGGLVLNPSGANTPVADFTSSTPTIAVLTGTGNVVLGNATAGTPTTLAVGGAAQLSGTLNGVISDASALQAAATGSLVLNNGSLTLNGANTFTGTLTVNNGTLTLNNTNTLTGITTINGGSLLLGNTNALADSSAVNLTGGNLSFTTLTSVNLAAIEGTSNLSLTNNASTGVALNITGVAGTWVDTGIITGLGSVTVSNAGISEQFGNANGVGAANYSGGTTVNNGSLTISGTSYQTGLATLNAGTLILGGTSTLTGGVALPGNGPSTFTVENSAVVTMSGALNTDTVNNSYSSSIVATLENNASVTVAGFSWGNGTDRVGGGNILNIENNASLIDNGTFDLLNTDGNTGNLASVTYNLSGGTLATQRFILADLGGNNGNNITLNLEGGTIEALASDAVVTGTTFLPNLAASKVTVNDVGGAGGATFNTNGFNDTIAQPIVHSGTGTDGGLTKTGLGTLTLTGADTYNGTTNINGGTLVLAVAGANGTGNISFGGGTLQYTSANLTDYSAKIVNSTGPISIDTNGQTITFATALAASNTGGLNVADSQGTGSLTLSSAALYTGPTTIGTGATLTLPAGVTIVGSTAVTNSGTLNVAGYGVLGTGSSANTTLNGGSTLSLEDGTIGSLAINGGLTVGGSTAATINLDFNGTSADQITVSGGMAYGTAGGVINLNLLGNVVSAPASGSTITLISDANGIGTPVFTLGANSTSFIIAGTSYTLTLGQNGSDTAEIVTLTAGISTFNYYFKGAHTTTGTWSDVANFATDQTGATAQGTALGATSNVFLVANNAIPANFQTETIDGNYTINSLSFTGGSSPAGTNGVTLNAGTATSPLVLTANNSFTDGNGVVYAGGTGLVVQAGSAAHTINANINLGSNQVWKINNSAANPLTMNGVIGNGSSSDSLTVNGTGELIINNANTYTGGTFVTGGTLALGASGALPTTGTLTVSGSGTFDVAGNSPTLASFSDGGVTTGTITNSSATAATISFDNTNASTFGGTITDNSATTSTGILGLSINGPGSLKLSGSNSFNGPVTVNGGILIASNNYALGNSASQVGGLVMSSGTAEFTSANPNVSGLNSAAGASTGTGTVIILGNTTGTPSATTLNLGAGGALINLGLTMEYAGTITDLSTTNAAAIGNLNVVGGSYLQLYGANTFTGVSTVTGANSELQIENPLALQDSTLYYNNQGGTFDFGPETTATLAGLTGSQALALNNDSNVGVALTIGNNNVTSTYTGNLGGGGSLTKNGTGTFTLGSGANGGGSYTGTTYVNGGALIIGGTSNLTGAFNVTGLAASTLTVQDNAVINSTGESYIVSEAGNTYPQASTLTVSGTASVTTGGLSLGNKSKVTNITVTVQQQGSLLINGAFNLLYNQGGGTASSTIVNLNGGVLGADTFTNTLLAGSAALAETLNLNGGTLEGLASDPNGSTFLPALTDLTVNVQAGGAIFNPNGFSDTIAAALVHSASSTTDGGLTVNGTGTLYLTGANSFNGGVKLNGGTLNINGEYALGGANYSGITFNGGTLQYAATLPGTNGTSDITANAGGTAEPVTIAAGGGTIDTNGNNITFANPIGNNGSGGFTKTGLGNLTLNGANSYTGATVVNKGTLTLNSGASFTNASPAITVASGAKLALLGNTIGTSGASLAIAGGATLTLQDGTVDTVTLNGGSGTALSVGDATAPANLYFDVSNGSSDELVVSNGSTTFGADGGTIYIDYLGTATPASSYTLVSDAGGGLASGTGTGSYFSLGTQTLTIGGIGYSLSLASSTTTSEILSFTQLSVVNCYWTGVTSGSWSVAGNFATDHTGLTPQGSGLNSTSNVFLTADNATAGHSASETLDGNYTINSLSFTGAGAAATTSITLSNGTGSQLTLDPISSFTDASNNSYGPGVGLVVQAGSAQHTIAANLALGESQSWAINNAPANGLIVSGTIGDGGSGYALTKTGAGTLILSASNTYTGATTITSGTLQLGAGAVGGSVAGAIVDNGALSLFRSDNYTFSNPLSGTGNLVQNGSDHVTLGVANTFSGSTTVNSGSLILGNSLALQDSAFNTNGAGALSFGSLTAATLGGLTGTGNLALANASSAAVNLTLNNNGAAESYSGTLSGAGSVTFTGSGTIALGGANSYDGATSINAGVVQISAANNLGDGSVNNTISMGGGTLESTANTYDLGVNRAITLTGSNGIQVDTGSSLSVSGAIGGAGNLYKSGAGALTLNGADSATGTITVSAGMLTVGASGSINGPTNLTLANGAILNIAGGSVTLPATGASPDLTFVAGGNNTQVYISGGSLTYSNNAGSDPNQAFLGTFTQTGGTVTTVETNMAPNAGNTATFYVGGSGQYISNAGRYGNFTVGTRGVANAYVSGNGAVTVNGQLIVGAQYNNGGDTAGTREFVQQGGSVTAQTLTLGAVSTTAAAPGVYYLNGGTLTTGGIAQGAVGGTSGGTLDFGGGTLASNAAFTVATGGIATNINSGGAIFNATNGNIIWAGVIGAGTAGNVTGFTGLSGGSGYTTDPAVTISGGGGTGATAAAIINAAGQVTDVVITNPGTGYTGAPTFAIAAPTAGTTASIVAGTFATGNGGLTAQGTGSLTLSANDTYTGPTSVTGGGTLVVSGSLSATSSVAASGGATLELAANNAISSSAHVSLTNATLETLASQTEQLADLTVGAGTSTLSLGATGSIIKFANSNADSWTGTLDISNWSGLLAGGGTDEVFIGTTGSLLTTAQLADVLFVNPTLNGNTFNGTVGAIQLSDGELVAAVPEPGTWAMMLGGLAVLGWWQQSRRRVRR